MIDDSQWWDIYHQKIHKDKFIVSEYARKVEPLFPRSSLILELGSGTGADALYFLQKGHIVIALDISEFALNVLQEKAKSMNLSNRLVVEKADFSILPLPVKDSSVDICYSRVSLNYFGAKETALIFADIYRVLKQGGRAFLILKSPDDIKEISYLEENATLYEPNVYIQGNILKSRFTKLQLMEILKAANIQGEVSPLRENLPQSEENLNPILYVNEVTFSKR